MSSDRVHVIGHPLIRDALGKMRDQQTDVPTFRASMRRVGAMLAYEATRDLPLGSKSVVSPMETVEVDALEGPPPALVTVLRAGDGLVAGMLETLPEASLGHVGIYRDPQTLEAKQYYLRLPPALDRRVTLVADPMLATGNSAVKSLQLVMEAGAAPPLLRLVCLLAAPEGLAQVLERVPGLQIYTASVDRQLDDRGYILPGLGDAGDRLFGTEH